MSDLGAWLSVRRPEPPEDLGSALVPAGSPGSTVVHGLTRSAIERLERARSRPGRIRESAFRLLESDALLTYACEAALESEDPEAELRSILSAIGS